MKLVSLVLPLPGPRLAVLRKHVLSHSSTYFLPFLLFQPPPFARPEPPPPVLSSTFTSRSCLPPLHLLHSCHYLKLPVLQTISLHLPTNPSSSSLYKVDASSFYSAKLHKIFHLSSASSTSTASPTSLPPLAGKVEALRWWRSVEVVVFLFICACRSHAPIPDLPGQAGLAGSVDSLNPQRHYVVTKCWSNSRFFIDRSTLREAGFFSYKRRRRLC